MLFNFKRVVIGIACVGLLTIFIYKFSNSISTMDSKNTSLQTNENFDKLMKKVEKNIHQKEYTQALVLLDQAEIILGEYEVSMPIQWAYIYDYRRYSLYELGKQDEALKVCREAIKKLNESQNWAYLPEYNVVRGTKRSCANLIAWVIQERAINEIELQEAIDSINLSFATISPIEDRSVFSSFYDTKALVFKKAFQFNPEKYELLFLSSLKDLETYNVAFDDEGLAEDLKSELYLDYIKNNPLEKIKSTKTSEAWQDSLERYKAFLSLIKTQIENNLSLQSSKISDYYGVIFNDKEDQQIIKKFEADCDCQIPPALKSLYLQTGTFSVKNRQNWGSFHLYSEKSSDYSMPNIGGMVKMIDSLWGGRPEFGEAFSPEEIKHLNENYFVFGDYFNDDNAYYHFYFDRQGNFGSVFYDQDDFDSAYKDFFKPLLTKSLAGQTLDDLLSEKVDLAIKSLVEEVSVN